MGKARNIVVAVTFVTTSGLVATFASGALEREPDSRPDMIWIPAVQAHAARGFWIDTTEVTNEQFSAFVRATGYVTLAERPPRAEDAPDVPLRLREAGSIVFTPPQKPTSRADVSEEWWRFVPGADWQHPRGPDSDLAGHMQEPVVHIARTDALAYAAWARKRLPTVAEWRLAAAQPDTEAAERGAARALLERVLPVASSPANRFGLFDMEGNVWEWVSDDLRLDHYAGRHSTSDRVGFRCVRDVSP
ncbi:MAG: SUMF1/EgtB/PvdO family nonheme iron enzyme [Myxococcales bacterium]